MATDFVSALRAYWQAEPTTTAAGIGTLYRDIAKGGYPYAVIVLTGSKVQQRVFTGGSARVAAYRINLFHKSPIEIGALGDTVANALRPIVDDPTLLTFDDGKLISFRPSASSLVKLAQAGSTATPNVWMNSLAYDAKIWND